MFFDNDLWLLSYSDVLVNMVNETFFFDLVKNTDIDKILFDVVKYNSIFSGKVLAVNVQSLDKIFFRSSGLRVVQGAGVRC